MLEGKEERKRRWWQERRRRRKRGSGEGRGGAAGEGGGSAVSVAGSRHLVTRVPALDPRLLGPMMRSLTPPCWKSYGVAQHSRPLPHQAATSCARPEGTPV